MSKQNIITLEHIKNQYAFLDSRRSVMDQINKLATGNSALGDSFPVLGPQDAYAQIDVAFERYIREPIAPPEIGKLPFTDMYYDCTNTAQMVFGGEGVPKEVLVGMFDDQEIFDLDDGQADNKRAVHKDRKVVIQHWVKKKALSMKSEIGTMEGMPTLVRERNEILNWVDSLGSGLQRTQIRNFWNVLNAGDTDTYGLIDNGSAFFDVNHEGQLPDGTLVANQTNYFTGGAATLNETNLEAIIQAVETYVDLFGNYMNSVSDLPAQMPVGDTRMIRDVPLKYHLFVGYPNAGAAAAITSTTTATPSRFAGLVSFEIRQEIGAGTHWFLIVRSGNPLRRPLNFWGNKPMRAVYGEADNINDYRYWIARSAFGFGYRNWSSMVLARP